MNVIDVWNLIKESNVIHAIIIFIAAFLADRFIIKQTINIILNKSIEKNNEIEPKITTLFSIVRTLLSFIIYFIAILLMIQIVFKTSVASIVTATGIVGVIAGLGVQSIVKDSISGFFILLENQYKVGDLVTVDNFTGRIEEVTIRLTTIKSFEGDRLIIPNGNMREIISHAREDKSIVVDVNISYDESIEKASIVLIQTLKMAENEMPDLTEEIEFLGVENLSEFSVTLRMLAHCRTDTQYTVKRELLKRIKNEFDKYKIKMPFQNLGEKHGTA